MCLSHCVELNWRSRRRTFCSNAYIHVLKGTMWKGLCQRDYVKDTLCAFVHTYTCIHRQQSIRPYLTDVWWQGQIFPKYLSETDIWFKLYMCSTYVCMCSMYVRTKYSRQECLIYDRTEKNVFFWIYVHTTHVSSSCPAIFTWETTWETSHERLTYILHIHTYVLHIHTYVLHMRDYTTLTWKTSHERLRERLHMRDTLERLHMKDYVRDYTWETSHETLLERLHMRDTLERLHMRDYLRDYTWETHMRDYTWKTHMRDYTWKTHLRDYTWETTWETSHERHTWETTHERLHMRDYMRDYTWKNNLRDFTWEPTWPCIKLSDMSLSYLCVCECVCVCVWMYLCV